MNRPSHWVRTRSTSVPIAPAKSSGTRIERVSTKFMLNKPAGFATYPGMGCVLLPGSPCGLSAFCGGAPDDFPPLRVAAQESVPKAQRMRALHGVGHQAIRVVAETGVFCPANSRVRQRARGRAGRVAGGPHHHNHAARFAGCRLSPKTSRRGGKIGPKRVSSTGFQVGSLFRAAATPRRNGSPAPRANSGVSPRAAAGGSSVRSVPVGDQ